MFGFGGVGIAGVNNLISFDNVIFSNIMNGAAFISFAAFMALVWSGGKYETRDYSEIRTLYQEFINNYCALNKKFGFNSPIEISAMYNFLLYKGYLSKDKKFSFTSKDAFDSGDLDGVNVVTGSGVCRHISSGLSDILKSSGIFSSRLSVYARDYNINVIYLDKPKYTKEELIDMVRSYVTDEVTLDYVMSIIDKYVEKEGKPIDITFDMADVKSIFKKIAGNHSIVFANQGDINYYLDPTQGRVYENCGNGVLCDGEFYNLPIRLLPSIVFNDMKSFLDMRDKISKGYPSVSLEDAHSIQNETLKICRDNTDIFERFYNENSGLYDEISSKVKVLKR